MYDVAISSPVDGTGTTSPPPNVGTVPDSSFSPFVLAPGAAVESPESGEAALATRVQTLTFLVNALVTRVHRITFAGV